MQERKYLNRFMMIKAFKRGALLLLLALSSCYRVPDTIEPKVDYAMQDQYLLRLPSPFSPLTEEEQQQDWAKEYRIALGFAHELDLYQAITAFKRSSYLIPSANPSRKLEIEYEIFLCYYIGKKYAEVIYTFEHSGLCHVQPSFPAFKDLLIILFDCYTQLKEEEKADKILQYLQTQSPQTAEGLTLSKDLRKATISSIETFSTKPQYSYLQPFLSYYEINKKSVQTTQLLNTFLPGAGYFYLGQRQSAITAFLLNGLFIGASYYFFHRGNIPAGVIFAGAEAGWYFGGIYGAGLEAKFYNERLYEQYATPMMNERGLFPAFMIQYGF